MHLAPVERTRYQRRISMLDQDTLAPEFAHGRGMALKEAVEYAIGQVDFAPGP
jgi:hypothetical protein